MSVATASLHVDLWAAVTGDLDVYSQECAVMRSGGDGLVLPIA